MKKWLPGIGLLVTVSIIFLYAAYGGFEEAPVAPQGTPFVKTVPDNWIDYRQSRMAARDAHIAKHQAAYNRFADFAQSETDGAPYIILKLLPLLAPEYWGAEDNFLSVMGLFSDERLVGAPLPRGMGFSGMSRVDPQGNIDYASFSCGACHIGRMRLDNGNYYYLDGGANAEFNVVGYRKRIVQTLKKITGNEVDPAKRVALVVEKINALIDKLHAQNPNYFYQNFVYENRKFDADYEQAQINLFKQAANTAVAQFIKHHEGEYQGWEKFVEKYYAGAQPQLLNGLPGMEDAIGFNTVKANSNLKENLFTKPFASLALPSSAGVTDIMMVWEQNLRDPVWSKDKKHLINGGGQWNGHIPLPIYKNIAAQLTIGYENVDIGVSAMSEQVLDQLPAPVYPFDLDVELAKKGQQLFAENCAACHQPHNGKVYTDIGTDMGRAKIAGLFVTIGAISGFTDICNTETRVNINGGSLKPCANYKGVSLEGKKRLAMAPPKQRQGYNALPLVGLWAQAPYLHNGSVPPCIICLSQMNAPLRLLKAVWITTRNLVVLCGT